MSKGDGFSFKDRSGKVHQARPRRDDLPPPPKKSTERAPEVVVTTKNHPEADLRLVGTIDKNKRGSAFLVFDDAGFEDILVPRRYGEKLFHGDRVEVAANKRGEILELEVLEHRLSELVGRFYPNRSSDRKSGRFVYESKKSKEEFYVPSYKGSVEEGHYIRAKIQYHETGRFPATAEIEEIFGENIPASEDIRMVAGEFGLKEGYSPASVREAEEHRLYVPGKDERGREDLRKIPFITIDGELARDFDDAVFVEKTKQGYTLWVAVADVSHYVTEDSSLDKEAKEKGTSVYFPERAFHMLPKALSENLCSLRPGEPRLAMVSKIFFSKEGKKEKVEVLEAIIQSHRRATYNEIEVERKANEKDESWEFFDHFELYKKLRKARSDRGSLDFELPEFEILVDAQSEPTEIQRRERLDPHRLIEEFMISANESVTEWMLERDQAFIYRIHEEPSEQSLFRFKELAKTFGVKINFKKGEVRPEMLSEILKTLEGHPAQELLNSSLLRSMKQAVYSENHLGHFGLASDGYTHFTSPIRRYPDLVVHRLIRGVLRKTFKHDEKEKTEKKLKAICEHSSLRERLAAEAERELKRVKQVRIMKKYLGQVFAGKVNGMSPKGLFIQIIDPFVEGFIDKETMDDDWYEYNEERMVFYGKKKKRTFKVGDTVQVQVVRADLDRRQVMLSLASETKKKGHK
ncbi:MAG: ribonuclease R [Xanthomonadaceae bacterium]|nr:ribonuclease R [Xanthomonadaceae bacterium]